MLRCLRAGARSLDFCWNPFSSAQVRPSLRLPRVLHHCFFPSHPFGESGMGETCCGGDGSAVSKGKSKSKGKALHSGELNSKVNHRDSAYLDSVIQKRIGLFQSIQSQQVDNLQKVGGDPIRSVPTY